MAQTVSVGELGLQQLEMLKGQLEQSADDARAFFKRKIEFLTRQMEKIQPALQEKHAMKQGGCPTRGWGSPGEPQKTHPDTPNTPWGTPKNTP
uniref:Prefoldin subunit 5 n=1 Tax=Catharus ustulatus TaxID=91951 RepID=A0A8C3UB41_CATUS